MSIKKYIPNHLSKKDTIKQKKNLEKSKKLYRRNKYFTRPKVKSFKSKKSRWITKAQTLYHIESIKPSKELAQKTKCSIKNLYSSRPCCGLKIEGTVPEGECKTEQHKKFMEFMNRLPEHPMFKSYDAEFKGWTTEPFNRTEIIN